MAFSKSSVRCAEARQIDMVTYLSSLGFEPAKISHHDYWYFSPLREEKTPSFKVNRRLNLWYDHGIGKGGNLIDFAILYHDCTIGEWLQKIDTPFSLHPPSQHSPERPATNQESRITILEEKRLTAFSLFRYLHQRRISPSVADRFCREVAYEINGRRYSAIGFKNDAGGYELRNPYFKGSSAPKDCTSIATGASQAHVFEGFFDFLSFMTIVKDKSPVHSDFLVLNSLSFFEKARPFMERHAQVNLYLDRDGAGQNCTRYALSLGEKYKDQSSLYEHYKDLNEWVTHIGKSLKDREQQNRKGIKL